MNTNILTMIEQAEVEWKPLGEVAELQRGKTITAKQATSGNIPVISGGQKPAYFTGDYNRNGETITVAGSGAYAGFVMYWNEPIFVGDAFSVKPNSSLLTTKYVYHFLLQNQNKIYGMKKGSGVPHVYPKDLATLEIPIPPLELQKEIVKRLDILTELEATLEAELILRKKQYRYYRDFLLSENELAKVGFEWKSLGEVADICLGLTYTPTYVDSGVKFISAQNTSGDFLDLSNVKYISEEEYERSTDNAKPKRGDVLFTRVGSNLGHPVIVETDEKLCIFVSLGFLRPKNRHILFNRYLKHWMTSDFFWEQVNKNVHGSAKVNLNTGWLKNFLIPLPVIDIQIKIAEILDKFDRLTSSITDGLPKEIELRRKQYEYYRELLLGFSQSELE